MSSGGLAFARCRFGRLLTAVWSAVLLLLLPVAGEPSAVDVERVGSWQIVERQDEQTQRAFGYQAVLSVDRSIFAFQCTADGREQLGVKFGQSMGPQSTKQLPGAYALDSQWAPINLTLLPGGRSFEVDPTIAQLFLIERLRSSESIGIRANDAKGVTRRTADFDLAGYAAAVDRTRALCETLR